jgi:hypothetical protein
MANTNKHKELWTENPDTECICLNCNNTWKLGESADCPICSGLAECL